MHQTHSPLFGALQIQLDHSRVLPSNVRRCIDGRYPLNGQTAGALARPGADGGLLVALLTLNRALNLGRAPEVWARLLYESLLNRYRAIFLHTSIDQVDKPTLVEQMQGCKHLELTFRNSIRAAMEPSVLERGFAEFQRCDSDYGGLNIEVLKGNHREKAIIVNDELAWTYNAQDSDGNTWYVYDRARDSAFISQVGLDLGLAKQEASVFAEIIRRQTASTLVELSKSLPVIVASRGIWAPAGVGLVTS